MHGGGGDDDDGGDDLADIVPASVSALRARRRDDDGARPLTAHSFAALRHKRVVVVARGVTYRGVLHGADEHDLYLRGALRWFVLPLEDVRSVARDDSDNDSENDSDSDNDNDSAADDDEA